MYLTYAEYQEMGGTLDATAFNDLEFEAESYIDWYTFNRLWNQTEYDPRLKRCMYHIIRLIELKMRLMGQPTISQQQQSANGTGQLIESMSNDGVSIRYNNVFNIFIIHFQYDIHHESFCTTISNISNNV